MAHRSRARVLPRAGLCRRRRAQSRVRARSVLRLRQASPSESRLGRAASRSRRSSALRTGVAPAAISCSHTWTPRCERVFRPVCATTRMYRAALCGHTALHAPTVSHVTSTHSVWFQRRHVASSTRLMLLQHRCVPGKRRLTGHVVHSLQPLARVGTHESAFSHTTYSRFPWPPAIGDATIPAVPRPEIEARPQSTAATASCTGSGVAQDPLADACPGPLRTAA